MIGSAFSPDWEQQWLPSLSPADNHAGKNGANIISSAVQVCLQQQTYRWRAGNLTWLKGACGLRSCWRNNRRSRDRAPTPTSHPRLHLPRSTLSLNTKPMFFQRNLKPESGAMWCRGRPSSRLSLKWPLDFKYVKCLTGPSVKAIYSQIDYMFDIGFQLSVKA